MKHSIIFFFFLLILNCNPDPSSGFKIQIKSSGDKILIDDKISINIISPNNNLSSRGIEYKGVIILLKVFLICD